MTDIANTILWVEDKRPSIRGYVDKINQEISEIHHVFSATLEDAMSKIDDADNSRKLYKVVFIDLHFESFPPELKTIAEQKNLTRDFNEGQFFALWLEEKLPKQNFYFMTGLSGAFNKTIKFNKLHDPLDKNIVLPSELVKKIIKISK